ncbi:MAG: PD40 domain-containing protein, partial [Candidatus Aminicenantes bacterium]|nr:PD40 domain-containing protein [Candidatus Aminicenantes bacterium]
MKKHSILIAILVFVAFSFGSFSIQNGHDLFQKALAKERAEGNLEEAICLYQKLVDETKDEALAAKAQYRIGICFEKLGLEKTKSAQEAFQKVMDNYPHQIEIVKLAQERLSSLLNAKAAAEKRDSEFILKKIGPGNTRGQGEVSPDGRYISFTDWNTGDLVVQDLIKREKYNITHKGSWEKSGAMAYSSRWSPDGGSIAYDWWDWDTEPNFVGIRIASRDGTKTRTLFQVSPDEGVSITCGWSPDGKYILAVIKREQSPTSSQFVLISVNDGSKRVLKTYYEKNEPEKAAFSPDGKHIILERRQADNPTNNDVFLLSMKSGEEIPLITHPADDRFLASAPDGEHILFLSDRRGTRDVWLLQMEGDEIKGTP